MPRSTGISANRQALKTWARGLYYADGRYVGGTYSTAEVAKATLVAANQIARTIRDGLGENLLAPLFGAGKIVGGVKISLVGKRVKVERVSVEEYTNRYATTEEPATTVTVTLTVKQMDDLRRAVDNALDELEARYERRKAEGQVAEGTRDFADRLHAIDAILRGHPNKALTA
jgi:hypothetical protein